MQNMVSKRHPSQPRVEVVCFLGCFLWCFFFLYFIVESLMQILLGGGGKRKSIQKLISSNVYVHNTSRSDHRNCDCDKWVLVSGICRVQIYGEFCRLYGRQ